MRTVSPIRVAALLVLAAMPVIAAKGEAVEARWATSIEVPLPVITSGSLRVDSDGTPVAWELHPDGTYGFTQVYRVEGKNLDPEMTLTPGAAQGASVRYTITDQNGRVRATSAGEPVTLGPADLVGVDAIVLKASAQRTSIFQPSVLPGSTSTVRPASARWAVDIDPIPSSEFDAEKVVPLSRTIAGGLDSGLAVDQHGALWGWGRNTSGQIGDGSKTNRGVPTRAVTIPGPAIVTQVAAGRLIGFALDDAGSVWAWGLGGNGSFGDGTSLDSRTQPGPVSTETGMGPVDMIVTGSGFVLALDRSGVVWAWGINTSGKLGTGVAGDHTFPTQVSRDTGMGSVVSIAANFSNGFALDEFGAVWAWGGGSGGGLGNGVSADSSVPVRVSTETGMGSIVGIFAGQTTAYALDVSGAVWAWGDNGYGKLGRGVSGQLRVPGRVSTETGMGRVVSVAARGEAAFALDEDGAVWAWGRNSVGQLGDGTTTSRYAPVRVSTETGMGRIVAIAAGDDFAYALDEDGALWSWGGNAYGQLGINSTTNQPLPVRVSTATGFAPFAPL